MKVKLILTVYVLNIFRPQRYLFGLTIENFTQQTQEDMKVYLFGSSIKSCRLSKQTFDEGKRDGKRR